ncbi:hypothetical protein XH80_31095 [Bradyrhizobium sp. CCBAU 45384]|nr:hypothetical protein [Bradyrhizobium sp. CCBAU 45384]
MTDISSNPSTNDAVTDQHLSLGLAAAAEAIRRGDLSSEAYARTLLRRAQLQSNLNVGEAA